MKKPIITPILVEVFDFQTVLAIGCNSTQLKNWIKKNAISPPDQELLDELSQIDTDESCHGKSFFDTKTHWNVLWLRSKPKTVYSISILAHEAVHIANFIFESNGVSYTKDDDEVLAYTVQFIVRKVLELSK